MKYEFLEHTADIKFRAYGSSLEEVFTNAALALGNAISDTSKVNPAIEKKIYVESENKEALLYDFLEKFLILLDSEGFLLNSVKKLSIKSEGGEFELSAVVAGDSNSKEYEIKSYPKAITYNDMFVKEEKDKFSVQVVVDI